MERIEAIISIHVTREGKKQEVSIETAGSVGFCMLGLAQAIVDMENYMPEERRTDFRTDFLKTVNDLRKESANANT